MARPLVKVIVGPEERERQRVARRELYKLTDEELDPNWFNNPEKLKRRDELLKIVDPIPTEEDVIKNYFYQRPYLEKKIVEMLRAGMTHGAIYEACEINVGSKKLNYLRKKHNLLKETDAKRKREEKCAT